MEKVLELFEQFEKYHTIRLTTEQELEILKNLTPDDFIGNGSSRAVYSFCGYVVKVAMSTGGMNQNEVEASFYGNHGYSDCFAHLYAHGEMINIMEELDDCGFYEYGDYYDEEDEEDTERHFTIECLMDEASYLTDYDGADNGQIGWSAIDNCYKLYDYGYSMDYDRDEIVDDVEDWMQIADPIANAIRTLETGEIITQEEFYAMWKEKWNY